MRNTTTLVLQGSFGPPLLMAFIRYFSCMTYFILGAFQFMISVFFGEYMVFRSKKSFVAFFMPCFTLIYLPNPVLYYLGLIIIKVLFLRANFHAFLSLIGSYKKSYI